MSGRKGGGTQGAGGGRGGLHERVKSARRPTASSTRWLQRQLNDAYVRRAQAEGYRSRAPYKLIEIDEKFGFLYKERTVVDLGITPGGWRSAEHTSDFQTPRHTSYAASCLTKNHH